MTPSDSLGEASSYQPEQVRQDFDQLGENEWQRLVRSPVDEVSLHLHSHYLIQHIAPGNKVLEIGAGPGRFTKVLAEIGARVWVADISPTQIALNKKFSEQHHFKEAIQDWRVADICDLESYPAGFFDAVVAYGGPFSYVLDRRDLALAQSLQTLKPGGRLLLSVMSLWGTVHRFLPEVLKLEPEWNRRIFSTGDLTPETYPSRTTNRMHLFRSDELRAWLTENGLEILDLSACYCLSTVWDEPLQVIHADPAKWAELLQIELQACAQQGCLDMGTHLIAVARKSGLQED